MIPFKETVFMLALSCTRLVVTLPDAPHGSPDTAKHHTDTISPLPSLSEVGGRQVELCTLHKKWRYRENSFRKHLN